MKQVIFIAVLIIAHICDAYCQIYTRYYPNGDALEGIKYIKNNSTLQKLYEMPTFKLEGLLEEDEENAENEYMLMRFGKSFETNYSMSDGLWFNVDGGKVWTIAFKSEGALSINFAFSDFRLPIGAELYITNQERTILYGPVTSEEIPDKGNFITGIIEGDYATIYLYEPKEVTGRSNLSIKEVVHGYRNLTGKDSQIRTAYTENDCFIDVACNEQYQLESDAVGIVRPDASHACSGALIMTANNSFIPYFLTAYHIMHNTNFSTWTFTFFNKKKDCDGTSYETSYHYTGATFKAGWDKTDFLLLQLTSDLSSNQKIAWLGWDKSNSTPLGGVCLGHPLLYPMKISIDLDSFTSYEYEGNGVKRYWKSEWDYGVIEHGMSGGPLLNSEKRIVGQMKAILNENGNTCDNDKSISGKFYCSWEGNGTSSTRLKDWLDPTNSGVTTTNSRRLHNPTIVGPDIICPNVTSTYTISDLGSDMTVQWLFDPNDNGADVPTLQTSNNTCTVENDCLKSWAGTLKATIKWQGQTVTVLKKKIICYSSFYATYRNGNNAEQEVILGSPVWVTKGQTVFFRSPNLINKNISYSVTTPSNPNYSHEDGNLNLVYPNVSTNNPIIINIQEIDPISCEEDSYQIIVLPNNLLLSYNLKASYLNNRIYIYLNPTDSDEGLNERTDMDDTIWDLDIFSLSTGQKIYSGKHSGKECTLDTTGWKSDIYLIQITIGDKTLTEKIIVKNNP